METEGRKGRRRLPAPTEELKHDLLIRCVGNGERVEDVAGQLGIGVATAYRLLRKVNKPENLMRPAIVATRPEPDDLRPAVERACARYGITHVEILASSADDSALLGYPGYGSTIRRSLGAMAARYVEGLLERGDLPPNARIGISGGRAAQSFADVIFDPARAPSSKAPALDVTFYPLSLVARWRVLNHSGANGAVQRLVHRVGHDDARRRKLRIRALCPEAGPRVIQELHTGKAWPRHPEIDAIVGPNAEQPHMLLTGFGNRWYVPVSGSDGPHEETSRFVRGLAEGAFYFAPRDRKNQKPSTSPDAIKRWILKALPEWAYAEANDLLLETKAVAEIFRCAIRLDGSVVPREDLDRSTLGVAAEVPRVQKWVKTGTKCVAMVGTSRMARPFHAILKTRTLTGLILDTAAAVQLLLLEDEQMPESKKLTPALFKHVALVPPAPKVAAPTRRTAGVEDSRT